MNTWKIYDQSNVPQTPGHHAMLPAWDAFWTTKKEPALSSLAEIGWRIAQYKQQGFYAKKTP